MIRRRGVANFAPHAYIVARFVQNEEIIMLRIRSLSVVAVGAILLAACGSSTKTATPAAGGGGGGSTTSTMDPSMVHGTAHSHDMKMPAVHIAKPLAVLADGTIDPTKVDLSGVPGVTPAQQKAAETLLKKTIKDLPKWKNYDDAIKDGFQSIQDGLTGEEHVIHWDWIDDKDVFDPTHPESLVYRVRHDNGVETKTLEAAMFLLPKQYTLNNAPNIGGALMQYHIHDNLCFTDFPHPVVAGLTDGAGHCTKPLVAFHPNIMVHVWIRPNPCGPFAALLGIGAGTTASGQRNCDHKHGTLSL